MHNTYGMISFLKLKYHKTMLYIGDVTGVCIYK